MFIQTEPTANPARTKFLPGCAVLSSGSADFPDVESSARSPLAQRLFAIEGVAGVYLDPESVTLTKSDDKDWQMLKPIVLGAIMDHFQSGKPVIEEPDADAAGPEETGAEDAISAQIKELIETRIRPAATDNGGDVTFREFKDGVVYLEFHGSASSLMMGIENMLRNYVPEVEAVKDHRDALPKLGLETPEGRAIQELLEGQVNPAVAAHGGRISLVDVKDDTAYIRLEGGCQGCGMADVTLKQGVATEIQRVAPAIINVLDVTDHAGGSNPYYQPGKGGMSPT